MSEPRGFNPVGQHAPGAPRHDAPLPGHVPGTPFANIGGDGEIQSPSVGYRDPNFPPWFGEWSGRIFLFAAMYITVPLQVALYPIAGLGAIVFGGAFYLLFRAMGSSSALDWAWTGCFIGLVALMRTETGFEEKNPSYRGKRHLLRLGLIFVFMVYFDAHDQGDAVGTALLMAAIFTAIMHFFLRWKLAQGLWDALQITGWMRKSPNSPKP